MVNQKHIQVTVMVVIKKYGLCVETLYIKSVSMCAFGERNFTAALTCRRG